MASPPSHPKPKRSGGQQFIVGGEKALQAMSSTFQLGTASQFHFPCYSLMTWPCQPRSNAPKREVHLHPSCICVEPLPSPSSLFSINSRDIDAKPCNRRRPSESQAASPVSPARTTRRLTSRRHPNPVGVHQQQRPLVTTLEVNAPPHVQTTHPDLKLRDVHADDRELGFITTCAERRGHHLQL